MDDNKRSKLLFFLNKIEANRLPHSARSLLDHLIGTYDLLFQWGCSDATCLAGGLHSIYGTNIFSKEVLSSNSRPLVREWFGAEAERLAWLFGSLNRPKAIEEGFGVDRREKLKIKLNPVDTRLLRLIEAANLLEQGSCLQRWPNIRSEAQKQMNM